MWKQKKSAEGAANTEKESIDVVPIPSQHTLKKTRIPLWHFKFYEDTEYGTAYEVLMTSWFNSAELAKKIARNLMRIFLYNACNTDGLVWVTNPTFLDGILGVKNPLLLKAFADECTFIFKKFTDQLESMGAKIDENMKYRLIF